LCHFLFLKFVGKFSFILVEKVIRAVAKNGSFGFAKGWPVCRAKPNVPLVRWLKLNLKKCAVGKIKNTEGSAMSVGLLAVRLRYGLYVFGQLSKWFVFVNSLMF